jgi:hypothetical protein
VLVFLIHSWLQFDVYLAFCLAGILGSYGAKRMDVLGKFIIQRTGLKDLSEEDGSGDSSGGVSGGNVGGRDTPEYVPRRAAKK